MARPMNIPQFFKKLKETGVPFERTTKTIRTSYDYPKVGTLGILENNRISAEAEKEVPAVKLADGRVVSLKYFYHASQLRNRDLADLLTKIVKEYGD